MEHWGCTLLYVIWSIAFPSNKVDIIILLILNYSADHLTRAITKGIYEKEEKWNLISKEA